MYTINDITDKTNFLVEEMIQLNGEERGNDNITSILGTIQYYEDFLAGYLARSNAKINLLILDYTEIEQYRPLNSLEFSSAFRNLKKFIHF